MFLSFNDDNDDHGNTARALARWRHLGALHEATETLHRAMCLAPYCPGWMVVTFAVNCITFFYIVDNRVAKYKLIAPLFYGKIGNISHPGHVEIFRSHRKFAKFFYHTECHTCFNIAPNLTNTHSHVICFLSSTRWLLPITPVPKELFLHALVIVIPLTYHIGEKKSFIISHVCGGTWRMTHCLHAFIVNITPEAEVLLKYHTCRYLPLFSP